MHSAANLLPVVRALPPERTGALTALAAALLIDAKIDGDDRPAESVLTDCGFSGEEIDRCVDRALELASYAVVAEAA